MVKDFKDIKPRQLKRTKLIYEAFDLLGISQQDLLRIFEDNKKFQEELNLLRQRVEELEEWKRIKIKQEVEKNKSYQTTQQQAYQEYMNGDDTDVDPFR